MIPKSGYRFSDKIMRHEKSMVTERQAMLKPRLAAAQAMPIKSAISATTMTAAATTMPVAMRSPHSAFSPSNSAAAIAARDE
jgi:hypothetical protein